MEFDRGSNSVHSGTENHDTVAVEGDVVLARVVGGVEVVGVTGELGGYGVDLLDKWSYVGLETQTTDSELIGTDALGDLPVRETELLCLANHPIRQRGDVVSAAEDQRTEPSRNIYP